MADVRSALADALKSANNALQCAIDAASVMKANRAAMDIDNAQNALLTASKGNPFLDGGDVQMLIDYALSLKGREARTLCLMQKLMRKGCKAGEILVQAARAD